MWEATLFIIIVMIFSLNSSEMYILYNKGVRGGEGMEGFHGKVGEKGLKGFEGRKGETGLPGESGIPGYEGNKGLKGEIRAILCIHIYNAVDTSQYLYYFTQGFSNRGPAWEPQNVLRGLLETQIQKKLYISTQDYYSLMTVSLQ